MFSLQCPKLTIHKHENLHNSIKRNTFKQERIVYISMHNKSKEFNRQEISADRRQPAKLLTMKQKHNDRRKRRNGGQVKITDSLVELNAGPDTG